MLNHNRFIAFHTIHSDSLQGTCYVYLYSYFHMTQWLQVLCLLSLLLSGRLTWQFFKTSGVILDVLQKQMWCVTLNDNVVKKNGNIFSSLAAIVASRGVSSEIKGTDHKLEQPPTHTEHNGGMPSFHQPSKGLANSSFHHILILDSADMAVHQISQSSVRRVGEIIPIAKVSIGLCTYCHDDNPVSLYKYLFSPLVVNLDALRCNTVFIPWFA